MSLIFGEKYYSDKQLFSHFKKVHDKTICFLLLHQQLMENGLSGNKPYVYYSINLLNKIMNLKKFIAMKEDAKNDFYTKKICKQISKKAIIITSGALRCWLSFISLNPFTAFAINTDASSP